MFEPDPIDWNRVIAMTMCTAILLFVFALIINLQGCENPSCTKDFDPPAWCDNLIGDEQPRFPWEQPPIDEDVPTDPLDDGPDASCTLANGPHPCPPANGDGSDDGASGDGSDEDCDEGNNDGVGSGGPDDPPTGGSGDTGDEDDVDEEPVCSLREILSNCPGIRGLLHGRGKKLGIYKRCCPR